MNYTYSHQVGGDTFEQAGKVQYLFNINMLMFTATCELRNTNSIDDKNIVANKILIAFIVLN